MNTTNPSRIVRLFAAMLVTVAIIALSAMAMHAPMQTQSTVTLKRIQTDRAATLYADRAPSCAWFVEMVLPTGDIKVADRGPGCAWFVEMVLPTTENELMNESLQSVAATL